MKIKKIGHCCLVIEENGKRIMIDPGKYTTLQNEEKNIDIVLITHEHTDHCHLESLKEILKNNPNAVILTNHSVGEILKKEGITFFVLKDGEERQEQGILIRCFGKMHKQVYSNIPQVENTGFSINDKFFYPGDALENFPEKVELVAFPVAGSWLKLSEVMDWLKQINPKIVFPVHDGLLNEFGLKAFYGNCQKILSETNINFKILENNKEEEF